MDRRTRRTADAITEALDEGRDVAEFLAHALCYVAAKEGGTEEVLCNRSGSWEAGHVRSLMEGTVGPDAEALDWYRKDAEPETGLCDAELRFKQGFAQRRHLGVIGFFVDGVTDFSGFEHWTAPFPD